MKNEMKYPPNINMVTRLALAESPLPPMAALLHQARIATNEKDWDKLAEVASWMKGYVDTKRK
jgi:hypothetical protein